MVFYYPRLMHSCIFYSDVGRGITTSIPCKHWKVSLGRGLVNISAIYFLVLTYFDLISFSATFSFNIWYLIKMCLVLECNTGFLDIFTMLVLSQCMIIGSLISILISFSIYFIQMTWLQLFAIATYFASAVLCDVQSYFLLNQETNIPPKKKAPSLVLFLSSILSSQSTSV